MQYRGKQFRKKSKFETVTSDFDSAVKLAATFGLTLTEQAGYRHYQLTGNGWLVNLWPTRSVSHVQKKPADVAIAKVDYGDGLYYPPRVVRLKSRFSTLTEAVQIVIDCSEGRAKLFGEA